jgi:hypothetical protein
MITTSVMKKRKRTTHYVNNEKFYNALVDYKAKVERASENNEPKPKIPEYVGRCFLEISNHLAFNTNFVNYPYIESMISDGYTDCVKYVLNFNPNYSEGKTVKNPFAYFTQICYWAFLRRIKSEKKLMDLYDKILDKNGFEEVFQDDSAEGDFSNYSDYNNIKDVVHAKMRY